uniref:Complex I assembly factor TIMMDC1, mitochondrial n=1 Tax=Panagrolaimus superbus TaxID=310955 RepID=A0A914ZD93_9BILA
MEEPQKDVTAAPKETFGWDRLKRLYRGEEYLLERDLCLKMSKTSFICGFVVGGLTTKRDAEQRFDNYAVGKKFLNRRDAFRRRNDFRMLMFLKNGFKMGFRACVLTGSVMVLTTHTTIFRDYFSPLYFPIYSATACGIFAFPLGLYGQIQALSLGLTTGAVVSGLTWLYALGHDKSINDAYILFRNDYEKELTIRNEEERKIMRLMKDEKLYLRSTAFKRLKEIEEQQLLNSVEDRDDVDESSDKPAGAKKQVDAKKTPPASAPPATSVAVEKSSRV